MAQYKSGSVISHGMSRLVVLEKLGIGASAAVYKVKDDDQKCYAIKSMIVQRNAVNKQVAQNELLAISQLDHPNIIQYYGSIESEGVVNMIMELATDNLRSYTEKKPDKALDIDELCDVLVCVTHGLEYLHSKGIIHRDIKPENILRVGKVWKICDFGVSSTEDLGKTFVGTSPYLAPEIIECMNEDNVYTQAVDFWALGITLFECYLKAHPFFICNGPSIAYHEHAQLLSNIHRFADRGFNIDMVIEMYRSRGLKENANYIKQKMSHTETRYLKLFKSLFEYIPYNRFTPKGIFDLLNSPKRIRQVHHSHSLPNGHQPISHQVQRKYSSAVRRVVNQTDEVIFLANTINLLKHFFNNNFPAIVEDIASIEFFLLRINQSSEEMIEYKFQGGSYLESLTSAPTAKAQIRNRLLTRAKELQKIVPESSIPLELIFRLLVCSVWEDLMDRLCLFIKQFEAVLECKEGEQVIALEAYATGKNIESYILPVMEMCLREWFDTKPQNMMLH